MNHYISGGGVKKKNNIYIYIYNYNYIYQCNFYLSPGIITIWPPWVVVGWLLASVHAFGNRLHIPRFKIGGLLLSSQCPALQSTKLEKLTTLNQIPATKHHEAPLKCPFKTIQSPSLHLSGTSGACSKSQFLHIHVLTHISESVCLNSSAWLTQSDFHLPSSHFQLSQQALGVTPGAQQWWDMWIQ